MMKATKNCVIINRRNELKYSQEYMAKKIGIIRQGYGHYETGRNEPDTKILNKISEILNYSMDYLHNPEPFNKQLTELSGKDENDIAKDLERIINNISTDGYANFDDRSIDEVD